MSEEKKVKDVTTRVDIELHPIVSEETKDKKENEVDLFNARGIDKIVITATILGNKLAFEAGNREQEFTEEIFVSAKIGSVDLGKMPSVDLNITEKCGAKLTKADAGKTI